MDKQEIISLISKIRDRANCIIIEELEKRNIKGLVPSHGDILASLFTNEYRTQKEFTEITNRKKNTVTALMKKLEQYGYIEKNDNKNDKRQIKISLTEKGKELKKPFFDISENLIERIYKGFTSEEQIMLVQLLHKLYDNLNF